MVWDTIVPLRGEPVERWGGIAYGLAAAAVALPEGWTARAIVRVGDDLADRAGELLAGLRRIDTAGLLPVPEPNNRVELVYRSEAERTERVLYRDGRGNAGSSTTR